MAKLIFSYLKSFNQIKSERKMSWPMCFVILAPPPSRLKTSTFQAWMSEADSSQPEKNLIWVESASKSKEYQMWRGKRLGWRFLRFLFLESEAYKGKGQKISGLKNRSLKSEAFFPTRLKLKKMSCYWTV